MMMLSIFESKKVQRSA